MNFMQKKHHEIVQILLEKGELQSSGIFVEMEKIKEKVSLITVKRTLSEMVREDLVEVSGSGRSTSYHLTPKGRLFTDIDAARYIATEPDKRFGLRKYNFDLLPALPSELFTDEELNILNNATVEYKREPQIFHRQSKKKNWNVSSSNCPGSHQKSKGTHIHFLIRKS